MPRAEPQRTCIVTRTVRPPAELMRFVLGPGDEVVPDFKNRLPGRGAWVTATREHVDQAAKRRLFSRAFKTEARVRTDLGASIDEALRADLRGSLALANKAGKVVTGFNKVEAALSTEPIAALLHAAEAAADGRRKLAQALHRRYGEGATTIPVADVLSGEELDLALGRSHVIHAALVAGAGSEGFLARWRRLSLYRGVIALQAAPPPEAGPTDEIEPAGS